ncbi:MAG: response regulator [Desulfobacteraceae bacterium]|nr:response regulator [Desulfobacteraceae bacterium]
MTPKVLLVDDDTAWLEAMQKELAEYADTFTVLAAHDGQQALDVMAAEDVSVVVSDLRMPGVDGFELLNRTLHQYPDISVLIITAYDRPKTRDVVFKSGADDYMTKPITASDLTGKINSALKKKSEGGSLHNVSLETFLQLVEMEQQTCTLRVMNKSAGKSGALFFRNGELLNARYGSSQGRQAVYEIFSWAGVSVSIENQCPVSEKQLEGELQAILLDAMRTKDESSEDFNPEEEEAESQEAPEKSRDEILLETPVQNRGASNSNPEADTPPPASAQTGPAAEPKARPQQAAPADTGQAEPESGADLVRQKINNSLGNEDDVEDIYEDPQWHYLIEQVSHMGKNFNTGSLHAIYLNKGRGKQSVIVPGKRAAVVLMNADTPRDRIIDAVM